MNKSFVAAIILGCALTACSSDPSDLRPSEKVSLDQVPPGTRSTDIYNLSDKNTDATPGHGHGDAGHSETSAEPSRPDVMLQGDQHQSDIGQEEIPAEEKTTDASKVENHN